MAGYLSRRQSRARRGDVGPVAVIARGLAGWRLGTFINPLLEQGDLRGIERTALVRHLWNLGMGAGDDLIELAFTRTAGKDGIAAPAPSPSCGCGVEAQLCLLRGGTVAFHAVGLEERLYLCGIVHGSVCGRGEGESEYKQRTHGNVGA